MQQIFLKWTIILQYLNSLQNSRLHLLPTKSPFISASIPIIVFFMAASVMCCPICIFGKINFIHSLYLSGSNSIYIAVAGKNQQKIFLKQFAILKHATIRSMYYFRFLPFVITTLPFLPLPFNTSSGCFSGDKAFCSQTLILPDKNCRLLLLLINRSISGNILNKPLFVVLVRSTSGIR